MPPTLAAMSNMITGTIQIRRVTLPQVRSRLCRAHSLFGSRVCMNASHTGPSLAGGPADGISSADEADGDERDARVVDDPDATLQAHLQPAPAPDESGGGEEIHHVPFRSPHRAGAGTDHDVGPADAHSRPQLPPIEGAARDHAEGEE